MSDKKERSAIRNVVPDEVSDVFVSENGTPIPARMTYAEYCYYNDEGLTIQEIKFADAYTDTPDLIRAAMEADVDEQTAKAWALVAIKKPQVSRRIEDNLAMARRSAVMSVRERQELLTNVARSNIIDCVKVGADGNIELDLDKARKLGSHKGIVSLKMDEKTDSGGGTSKSRSIQMTNPISAIQELNKMQGVYTKDLGKAGAVVIIPAEDMDL